MTTVAVTGANGRVGRAICERLAGGFSCEPIVRSRGESVDELAARAVRDADVLLNAAGVAHLDRRPTPEQLDRLRAGNVDLPRALARAALDRGIPFVHVSSVKAADTGDGSPYAASKREADERLEREFGERFAARGLALVSIRPLALLLPPFDAGKLRWLRPLRWWPEVLTPAVALPALTPESFLDAVGESVEEIAAGRATDGFTLREFGRGERATVRDVRAAMIRAGRSLPHSG